MQVESATMSTLDRAGCGDLQDMQYQEESRHTHRGVKASADMQCEARKQNVKSIVHLQFYFWLLACLRSRSRSSAASELLCTDAQPAAVSLRRMGPLASESWTTAPF